MLLHCRRVRLRAAEGQLRFQKHPLLKSSEPRGGRTHHGNASRGWILVSRAHGSAPKCRRTTTWEQELLRTDVGLSPATIA